MIEVKGKIIDTETRCEHYATSKDIIAIKFYCCNTYYPCYQCHEACAGHAIERWPEDTSKHQAILCGVCQTEHTIETYVKSLACPTCESVFNEGCRTHYSIYFDM